MVEPVYCSRIGTCTIKYAMEKNADFFRDDPRLDEGVKALRENQCYKAGNAGKFNQCVGLR